MRALSSWLRLAAFPWEPHRDGEGDRAAPALSQAETGGLGAAAQNPPSSHGWDITCVNWMKQEFTWEAVLLQAVKTFQSCIGCNIRVELNHRSCTEVNTGTASHQFDVIRWREKSEEKVHGFMKYPMMGLFVLTVRDMAMISVLKIPAFTRKVFI